MIKLKQKLQFNSVFFLQTFLMSPGFILLILSEIIELWDPLNEFFTACGWELNALLLFKAPTVDANHKRHATGLASVSGGVLSKYQLNDRCIE